jgi:hypothetical protein
LRAMDRLHHAGRLMMKLYAFAAALALCPATQLSAADEKQPPPTYVAHVDMKTFMEHVLTPASKIIWRSNAILIDAKGEHDLSPRTDADWEEIVSGAATLAEATNAMMIPERQLDREWAAYVRTLADAADKAYQAAENHDLKTVSEVSDRLDGICAACHRHYGVE